MDDQAIVRRAIRALLETNTRLEVLGEAASGEAAVRLVTRLRPNVVLMDRVMPGMRGIVAIRQIVQRGCRRELWFSRALPQSSTFLRLFMQALLHGWRKTRNRDVWCEHSADAWRQVPVASLSGKHLAQP